VTRVWLVLRPLVLWTLVILGVVFLVWLVSQTVWIWVVVLLALILSAAMRPLVRLLQRLHPPGSDLHLSRGLSLLIVYIVLGTLIGVGSIVLADLVIGEVQSITAAYPVLSRRPADLVTELVNSLALPAALVPSPAAVSAQLRAFASTVVAGAASVVPDVLTFFVRLIFVMTLAAFMVLQGENTQNFLVSLLPPNRREHARVVSGRMGAALGNWILGLGVSMIIIGVISGAAAALIGLPAPALFGILSALLEASPMLGQILMVIPAVLVGLLISPVVAVEAAIAYTIIAVLDGSVISPLVQARAVHLSPVVIVVAIPIGATLYGGLGAILSIPICGALQIFAQDVILPWIHEQYGERVEPAQETHEEPPRRAA
jgi:predicted PurR-regulated permease PerM